MSNFVKTLKDEFTDQDWILANHIYDQVQKAADIAVELDSEDSLIKAIDMLKKVSEELSKQYDEEPSYDPFNEGESDGENYGETEGMGSQGEEDPYGPSSGAYEDFGDDPASSEEDDGSESPSASATTEAGTTAAQAPSAAEKKVSRYNQPTPEEIRELRAHTLPAEQRLRDKIKVTADPAKNPILHQQGLRIEARELAHKDRKAAYQALINSPEYTSADPIAQIDMDDNFEKDWQQKNPDHSHKAVKAHHDAHKVGEDAQKIFDATKQAELEHVASGGGASPDESMSTEEAFQHVGGTKGEAGTTGSIQQDPASAFAAQNQDFVRDLASKRKSGQPQDATPNVEELTQAYNPDRKSISEIFGPEVAKNPKLDKFIEHHYPLIGSVSKKTMQKLGLDHRKNPDMHDSLVEPGLLGLMNAINTYDHSNPKKASFATWARRTMHGLMLSHLKNQDPVKHARAAQKQHAQAGKNIQQPQAQPQVQPQAVAPAAPTKPKVLRRPVKELISSHPASKDLSERLMRIQSQKAASTPKKQGE